MQEKLHAFNGWFQTVLGSSNIGQGERSLLLAFWCQRVERIFLGQNAAQERFLNILAIRNELQLRAAKMRAKRDAGFGGVVFEGNANGWIQGHKRVSKIVDEQPGTKRTRYDANGVNQQAAIGGANANAEIDDEKECLVMEFYGGQWDAELGSIRDKSEDAEKAWLEYFFAHWQLFVHSKRHEIMDLDQIENDQRFKRWSAEMLVLFQFEVSKIENSVSALDLFTCANPPRKSVFRPFVCQHLIFCYFQLRHGRLLTASRRICAAAWHPKWNGCGAA